MNSMLKNNRIEFVIHLLVWALLFFLPYAFTVGDGKPWTDLFQFFWSQIILLMVIFYINYLILVNRWFFNDKKLIFYIINILLIVLFVWLRHQSINWLHEQDDNDFRNNPPPFALILYRDALVYLIPVVSAIAIHSGKRLLKVEVLKQEADNVKLQSELQHLKYQLQPHFFFNSLNNIYALIDTQPEKAKQTIHSLSKLMRHLLQNSEEEKIELAEEVNFLNKYISLMALRQNENTQIKVDFPTDFPTIHIAPLLFVSVIENAFKHGVSAVEKSPLSFALSIEGNDLKFVSVNNNFPKTKTDLSGSGIGLENLKKRLALLYPNKHSLTITSDAVYKVILEIEIN